MEAAAAEESYGRGGGGVQALALQATAASGGWYEIPSRPRRASGGVGVGRRRGGGGSAAARSTPWQRFKDSLRSFFAFVFSNVGICVLVIGYLLIGAASFQQLEAAAEIKSVGDGFRVSDTRRAAVERLWCLTERLNILEPGNWSASAAVEILRYQKFIVEQAGEGYNGRDRPKPQWSYSGALLYSITVITTIGYGHIAPSTVGGKIFTMVYALVGMPLFLLYLSNIGNIMAKSFKWTYSSCCKLRRQRQKRNELRFREMHGLPPARYSDEYEVDDEDDEERRNNLMITEESGRIATLREEDEEDLLEEDDSDEYSEEDDDEEEDDDGDDEGEGELIVRPRSELFSGYDDEYDDDVEAADAAVAFASSFGSSEDDNDDLDRVTVPISLCLLVMISYILGGAVLFAGWEGWNILDGSYFCFITLSTIGFGDMVPGASLGKNDDEGSGLQINPQFIFCSMYILLGMAVIAMCFNLMQEKVVQGITSFGKKLGVIKDE